MAHYSPIFCSCIVCKTTHTTANLPQHYRSIHECVYPKPPKLLKNLGNCKSCQQVLLGAGYEPKTFCNRSCAAKYNNSIRSETSRAQQKASVSETMKAKVKNGEYINPNPAINKCDVYFHICHHCTKPFTTRNCRRKLCSEKCLKLAGSIRQSKRLKEDPDYRAKLGTSNRSYPELRFSEWLEKYQIDHVIEKQFFNEVTDRCYFADFYFENLHLIIEIDGNQHLKSIEHDQLRDQYILTKFGVRTIRIPAREYLKGEWEEKLKEELLVASAGLEPATDGELEAPALTN